ncbi:MAG: PBSX family phage terminase large subunit, partial [Nitrospira sp.]|nr:PBSX family phage terminase large subunit [Nitrospira sp.]
MPKLLQPTFVCRDNQRAFENPDIKIIVNQGGARSSKTISIAQLIILHCLNVTGLIVTIVRKTTPALHSSVMRDFFWILNNMGLYSQENHNKSLNEYRLNGNLIEFISMDIAEKKKGTKRDILWLNEATEFDYEDYFQLSIRTTQKIFLDYNPSYEFHWIYERVLTRKDTFFIQSSYKDNPYLEQTLVDEIERLKEVDENYWKIY